MGTRAGKLRNVPGLSKTILALAISASCAVASISALRLTVLSDPVLDVWGRVRCLWQHVALVADDLHTRHAQSLVGERITPAALCRGTLGPVAAAGAQAERTEGNSGATALMGRLLLMRVILEATVVSEVQTQVANEDDRRRVRRQQALWRHAGIAQHLPFDVRIALVEPPCMAVEIGCLDPRLHDGNLTDVE